MTVLATISIVKNDNYTFKFAYAFASVCCVCIAHGCPAESQPGWALWLDSLQERVAKDKLQFRTVFQRADANSDGALTRKELKVGLQKMKVPSSCC